MLLVLLYPWWIWERERENEHTRCIPNTQIRWEAHIPSSIHMHTYLHEEKERRREKSTQRKTRKWSAGNRHLYHYNLIFGTRYSRHSCYFSVVKKRRTCEWKNEANTPHTRTQIGNEKPTTCIVCAMPYDDIEEVEGWRHQVKRTIETAQKDTNWANGKFPMPFSHIVCVRAWVCWVKLNYQSSFSSIFSRLQVCSTQTFRAITHTHIHIEAFT